MLTPRRNSLFGDVIGAIPEGDEPAGRVDVMDRGRRTEELPVDGKRLGAGDSIS